MAEWGFGSPSAVGAATGQAYYDWGFGDPSPAAIIAANRDGGFGSPTAPDLVAASIVVPADGKLPDEGGWMVRLICATGFPDSIYRARFRDSTTGDLFPNADFCFNGDHGEGTQITPTGPQNLLDSITFACPSAPPGTYDVVLQFGPNFAQEVVIEDAFIVINRNRCDPALRGRHRLPPYYKTGPVRMRELSPPSAPETLPPLEALTLAVGQGMQQLLGIPTTRLTADAAAGAATLTVETTLGFPSSGHIFIGQLRLRYTATTATSFTGIAPEPTHQIWQSTLSTPATVRYDASSYKPND